MDVTIKIKRYNPDKQAKPYWQTFNVKDIEPTDQILDVLHRVKWEQDGTLTLRRSCAHGVCGSDAMRINGYNRLACKTLVQDTGATIQVEPINGLPVIRDLVVDMEPFFDHYRSVMPYFINNNPVPADGRERLQSHEDRMKFDDSTKCILCACCTTSCPSFWANDRYVGPAAIVQAHRFIFDTRDEGNAERIEVLSAPDGVWRCRTIFNCTPACPRDIEVTRAIGEVKLAIQRNGKTDGIIQISEIH
ncbi:MAG: succinate dehydrogenase iron-sulfur subunit [Phototrophicaceae bacterium]